VESPWYFCYEVARLGLAFPSSPLGGDCPHTLEGTSLGLEANSHLSSSLGCFEPMRKGLPSPRPRSEWQPEFRRKKVTSDAEIYSVPISAATRDSPSCMGMTAHPNNYAQMYPMQPSPVEEIAGLGAVS
jgi:hypothetical protein